LSRSISPPTEAEAEAEAEAEEEDEEEGEFSEAIDTHYAIEE